MGKRNRRRRGDGDSLGKWMRLAPDPAEVTIAWANLLGAIVLTMQGEGVGATVIHGFLDRLDAANIEVLEGRMLAFVLHVTDEFRTMVPSND
jgi:hypothetical protein